MFNLQPLRHISTLPQPPRDLREMRTARLRRSLYTIHPTIDSRELSRSSPSSRPLPIG
jgi:hypothetical protein